MIGRAKRNAWATPAGWHDIGSDASWDGHTSDFAEHVLRVAHATGATHVAVTWALYTEATGHTRPDWARSEDVEDRYYIVDVGDARGLLDQIAHVDVTARCRTCKRPIEDGRSHCYEHAEPLIGEAARAVAEVAS